MNEFLQWHYQLSWEKTFTIFKNLFLFPIYFFSVPLHSKTLFSPWKRQVVVKKAGFNFDNIISVISFNLTSAVLGLIVRITVIVYGLALSLLLPLIFLPVVLIWPFIPFLTYPYYHTRAKPPDEQLKKLLAQKDFQIQVMYFCRSALGRFLLLRLGLNPLSFINNLSPQETIKPAASIEELLDKFSSVLNFKLPDLTSCYQWYKQLLSQQQPPLLLTSNRIRSLTGIGTDWAYGYTVTLDKFSLDLTKKPSPYPFLLGREEDLKEIQRGLLKSENNNVLVIGEPGIGRHILIETLAHYLYLGICDPHLSHKRIIQLDMHSLFAEAPNRDKLKALFSNLLNEAVGAGNIIIVIDEIDKYISEGEGRIDLTDVLEKFASSRVGVIGIITPDNYRTFIEKNDTLNNIFVEIRLNQPSTDLVLTELQLSIVPVLEKKYPVTVTLPALKKTIANSQRFLTSTPFPGKAIELLEDTVIWKTNFQQNIYITAKDIDDYLSQKLKLPLGELAGQETEKLTNLENLLHKKVINQHQAIRLIAGALRRARLNISEQNRPIGSFLFLGPTGVGKTETAKALNEIYFADESRMLRFDMSQYQGEEGLVRLIGSSKEKIPGELTSRLREKPYGVVLFDEIEKAPTVILNLFLTLLDEGYITDGYGKKVDCLNTIIIATSNAGGEFIRECLVQGIPSSQLSVKITTYVLENKIFSPEFINRFDSAVVFTPLSEGQLREIAKLMLVKLNNRLQQKELSLEITPDLINHLAGLGSNLEFGARSIRREIETNIEDQIAKQVLKGSVSKNQPLRIVLDK